MAFAAAQPGGFLPGFGPFCQKESTEWLRSRRPFVLLGLFCLMEAGSLLGTRALLSSNPGLKPLENWTSFVLAPWLDPFIFALFWLVALMGLLAGEREAGTLSWVLTKPLSRTALLLAKWLVAIVMLWIFSVVLPAAIGALAARLFFGNVDFAVVALVGAGQILSVALVVLLVLAASTVVTSRALVVGIGLAVMLAPHFLRPLAGVPLGQPFMEAWPSSIAGWVYAVSQRMPASTLTPIGYSFGVIILAVLAKLRFDAEELR